MALAELEAVAGHPAHRRRRRPRVVFEGGSGIQDAGPQQECPQAPGRQAPRRVREPWTRSDLMTPEQAVERLNTILAHAWMVRTFLKHADEIQEDEAMLDIHRMIFDYVRAVEPASQRGDAMEYLHRARGKLSKLRRVAEFFAQEHRRVSDHTNFQMAAISLTGCVREIEEVLAAVSIQDVPRSGA